jgi:hypothetical protein
MDAASRLGAARVGYGSPHEIARARARNEARFGIAPANQPSAGNARPMPPEPPRSTHAMRSAAQNILLEAQAQAIAAFERLPAPLRAPAAHTAADPEADFAAAEDMLNRLRGAASPPLDRASVDGGGAQGVD